MEALDLADPDVRAGRLRRLKRALDLDVKHKDLKDYAPDMNQETWKEEIYDEILKIRARDQEFLLLNQHKK